KVFREWALKQFHALGLDVWEQPFTATSGITGKTLEGANIIAVLNSEAESFLAFSCHWDSREFADQDPDTSRHKEHVPAANDGASGVAVLLEIARVLSQSPLPYSDLGIVFLLYDFEDQGRSTQAEEFAL